MIFEQYSYKTKFKALLVLLVLLSITAYKRSYGNLVKVYRENVELRAKKDDMVKKSKRRDAIVRDLTFYDELLGEQNVQKEVVQQQLVSFASRYHDLSIAELVPVHSFATDDYIVNTNQMVLGGNLNSLLRLSYDFEKGFASSRLASFHFYKTRKNSASEKLQLKLYFQNYESNK